MKYRLKLILAILFMAVAVNSYAAKNDDITLIVTSDGATKDEAIKNALRSAIEQTYGVFVSANTDILNDEIVSDEIATVASGNIKSYKELSTTQSDGTTTVTLEAVVSVGKLISYAKSKGAECEFDGDAFVVDLELQELYKANEEKAIENLVTYLLDLFANGYDYDLKISKAKSEVTGYFTDSYGYTHYGTYSTSNGNPEDVCLQYNIKIKLNEAGAQAWSELEKNLKLLGKEFNPNKITFSNAQVRKMEEIAEMYPAQFLLPPTGKYYRLRSKKSVMMLSSLMHTLPELISNVSLECGERRYDISKTMQFVDENTQPAAQSYLISQRAMKSKKGQNCGEYQGFINLPKSTLKQIKTIKVVQNH